MARPARRSEARVVRIRTEILGEGEARTPRVVLYDALHFATGAEGFNVWRSGGGNGEMRAKYGIEKGNAREVTGPRPYLIDGRNVPAVLADLKKQSARPAIEKVAPELASICGDEVIDEAVYEVTRKLDHDGGHTFAPLNDILDRDVKVRYTRLVDGSVVFHLTDLVLAMMNCSYSYAYRIARRITGGYYNVASGVRSCTAIFGGQGCRPTIAVAIVDAVKIALFLPASDVSTNLREKCASALVRLAGGDLSIVGIAQIQGEPDWCAAMKVTTYTVTDSISVVGTPPQRERISTDDHRDLYIGFTAEHPSLVKVGMTSRHWNHRVSELRYFFPDFQMPRLFERAGSLEHRFKSRFAGKQVDVVARGTIFTEFFEMSMEEAAEGVLALYREYASTKRRRLEVEIQRLQAEVRQLEAYADLEAISPEEATPIQA